MTKPQDVCGSRAIAPPPFSCFAALPRQPYSRKAAIRISYPTRSGSDGGFTSRAAASAIPSRTSCWASSDLCCRASRSTAGLNSCAAGDREPPLDEFAPPHVEHGGFLPASRSAARSACRRAAWRVPRAGLNYAHEPDYRHRWLLRPRRARPRCCRAAEHAALDVMAHSITSSARARNVGGTRGRAPCGLQQGARAIPVYLQVASLQSRDPDLRDRRDRSTAPASEMRR
jgi:hypothetical protein